MKTIRAFAPAKINLNLEVGNLNKTSGKHEVKNLMQTLTLHDNIEFIVGSSSEDINQILKIRHSYQNTFFGIKEPKTQEVSYRNLSLAITTNDLTTQNFYVEANDNLIVKTIFSVCDSLKVDDNLHIEIFLEKNIPSQAGLGGGSADAAATLLSCPLIFMLDKKDFDLNKIARKLGSDIFYLTIGGLALMEGDGSILKKTYPSLKEPIVLIKPKCGVSTSQCYDKFDNLLKKDHPKGDFKLANDLILPAQELCNEIGKALSFLKNNTKQPDNVSMTGSGSACFAITDGFVNAQKIATKAKQADFWARACSCSQIGAHARLI